MNNTLIYTIIIIVLTAISGAITLLPNTSPKLHIESIYEPMDFAHTKFVRGAAILCIVLGHIGNLSGITYFAPLGGMGVAAFLLISGYGLEFSRRNNPKLKGYWKDRFVSILIPYYLIRLGAVFIQQEHYSMIEYLGDFTLLRPLNPNGWYMTCILFWYVAFYVLHKVVKNQQIRDVIYTIMGGGMLFCPNELWGEQAFSFFMGILIQRMSNREKLFSVKACMSYGFTFVIAFAIKQITRNYIESIVLMNSLQLLYKCALAMLLFGVSYLVFCKKENFGKTRRTINVVVFNGITLVGIISYEIYLTHGYFFDYVRCGTSGLLAFYCYTLISSVIVYQIHLRVKKAIKKQKYMRN